MSPPDNILDELRELKHLGLLRLEPGDVLVWQHPGRLSEKAFERIRDELAKVFGLDKPRILLLEEGATLGVIRKQDTPPPPPRVPQNTEHH